jgi:hypothetical protein
MTDPFNNDFDGMSFDGEDKNSRDASAYDKEYMTYDKEFFKARMSKDSISTPVRDAMVEALEKTSEAEHSVIFVATNGGVVIEAIHVPAAALNGNLLELFPSANANTIIAAWSADFVRSKLDFIENQPEDTRDSEWEEFVGWMTDKVIEEFESHPPTLGTEAN